MKKLFFAFIAVAMSMTAVAQDIQLHYDFGRDVNSCDTQGNRPRTTATFEHFSLDNSGSWYYFIDLDFYKDGAAAAYTEVSREFNIGTQGFAAHIEYDGGLCSKREQAIPVRYQSAGLLGAAYNGHSADFKTTYSIQLMYKQYFKGQFNKAFSSAQLTGVWSHTFCNDALTFAGFFDFWLDKKADGDNKIVFATEPQLWFNLSAIKGLEKCPISIGTEQEIYNNFYTDNAKFTWNPTIALKWKF